MEKTSIRFKCPGSNAYKTDSGFIKGVLRTVEKKSKEFTGVSIAGIFLKPDGNFNLYEGAIFYGSDSRVYRYIGVDTENWKGFSVRITRLTEAEAKKVPKEIIKTIKA